MYELFVTLNNFAGKYTFAQIGVAFLGDLSVSATISHAVTIGAVIYGYSERRLRLKTVERLAKRQIVLEEQIDKGRSSSGLTPRGTTRPEDKP